jgi:hypothetical protein
MDAFHETGLLSFQVSYLVSLLVTLFLKLLSLSHEVVHCVVLANGQSRPLLYDLIQMGNLISQVLDDLPGFFFLFFGLLDQFPSFFNFFPENINCLRVFLGELDGCLDFSSILENGVIQILAPKKEGLIFELE